MGDETDDPKAAMREELANEFEDADFPVSNQMDLVPALSNGPGTKFSAAGIEVTAMELATTGSGSMDYPYDDLDSFLDDSIEAMDEAGYFD